MKAKSPGFVVLPRWYFNVERRAQHRLLQQQAQPSPPDAGGQVLLIRLLVRIQSRAE
jgi:hypothetical protein